MFDVSIASVVMELKMMMLKQTTHHDLTAGAA